jgi:hypothetical protein
VDGFTFERKVIGNSVRLEVVSAVPLPASAWLLVSALGTLLRMRIRGRT